VISSKKREKREARVEEGYRTQSREEGERQLVRRKKKWRRKKEKEEGRRRKGGKWRNGSRLRTLVEDVKRTGMEGKAGRESTSPAEAEKCEQ
jgi:hypothetical protein